MQQPLLHWLLAVQIAWHELSLLTQTAPFGTVGPLWQQWVVATQA
jgi:hypothetical protein